MMPGTPELHLKPAPQQPEPTAEEARSVGDWLKKNLFNTWYNSLLTLVLAPALAYLIYRVLRFVFVTSDWTIIEVNLANYMVGTYPRDELWRITVMLCILAVVTGLVFGVAARANADAAKARGIELQTSWKMRVRRVTPLVILAAGVLVFVRTATPFLLFFGAIALGVLGYFVGVRFPRERRWIVSIIALVGVVAAFVEMTMFGGVAPGQWGGFFLNVLLAVLGVGLCYPIGVLLALGRRSSLPAIRVVCIAYIEVFRALPLVALLFMGWLILPFFLPRDFPTPDVVWRALIIFIMFTAAYIAEIVRGGLQSIPKGQYEAAYALGLRVSKIQRLIVLPQALRNVIPATVGQFISLFKDTSLLLIIGITDVLEVARSVTQQEKFLAQGFHAQSLLFAAFLFWMGSYWMSRESQRMEQRLGVGER